MVKRPIVSEPFTSIIDLVGPLPKGKGKKKYLLTYIHIYTYTYTYIHITRWPDAIPLCSITAKPVAQCMLDIFSRTGIPLEMLTDQGSQFVARLTKELLYKSFKQLLTIPKQTGL